MRNRRRPVLVRALTTPTEAFYGRNHGPIPKLDPDEWRLDMDGLRSQRAGIVARRAAHPIRRAHISELADMHVAFAAPDVAELAKPPQPCGGSVPLAKARGRPGPCGPGDGLSSDPIALNSTTLDPADGATVPTGPLDVSGLRLRRRWPRWRARRRLPTVAPPANSWRCAFRRAGTDPTCAMRHLMSPGRRRTGADRRRR